MHHVDKIHSLRAQLGMASMMLDLQSHRQGLPDYAVRTIDKHQFGQRFRWMEIVETRPQTADRVLAITDAIIGSGPDQDAEALRHQRNAERMVDGLRMRR